MLLKVQSRGGAKNRETFSDLITKDYRSQDERKLILMKESSPTPEAKEKKNELRSFMYDNDN